MSYSYSRRRSSIFGGLLLLTIGVLFLIHNLAPGVLHMAELVRYWPVLLIVWGLARLWDHFASVRTGQAPPRTVSGGDLLLILLALVAVAALATYDRMHRNVGWQGGFDLFASPYTFTTTLPAEPVEPSKELKLWTPRGNITVHPEQTQNVNVVVTKTVRAENESAAQKVASATTVAIAKTSAGLQVSPQIPARGNVQVSYDASVFPKTSLVASTGRGQVHVNGIEGEISLSASGQVEVSQGGASATVNLRRGDAHIHSVSGNVTVNGRGEQIDIGEIGGQVSINGEFYGPIRVRRVDKDLTFHSRRTTLSVSGPLGRLDMDSGRMLLSDTKGNISLATRDKDIQMENVTGALHVVNRNGNVEVRYSQPPRSNIDITNRSGDIDLVLPDRSAFSITAMAHSGDISSDFRSGWLRPVEQESNTVLDGTLGSGGPKITLKTTYGTIHIRRGRIAPQVPVPFRPPIPPRPPVPPKPGPSSSQ